MKSFASLTRRGKARRLRRLTLEALERYDLQIADVRLVGMYTNALWRVRTVAGAAYAVRVCRPGWRTETDLRSEIAWLQALSRDTDIGAPRPQRAKNGAFYVKVGAAGVPEVRRCVVMSWVTGTPLEKRLTEANLYKLGVLFARLHAHAAGFLPPPGFTRRRMDNIYARGEEDALFSAACLGTFPARQRQVLARAKRRVDEAFAQLYADPTGLRVIHNDLWHGNVKIHRGRLHPLDFEDTLWGYPAQDIAMALQDLMTDVTPAAFEPLQGAFRQGYESRGHWPEDYDGQIDTFRAGRMLWVANYVARFERPYLGEHIERLAGQFERFLESGLLRKA